MVEKQSLVKELLLVEELSQLSIVEENQHFFQH